MTLMRVNLVNGIGPTLQIAEGYTCVLDDDIHTILDERIKRGQQLGLPLIWEKRVLNRFTM